jgi:uncharacterized delta-60 repeat protein
MLSFFQPNVRAYSRSAIPGRESRRAGSFRPVIECLEERALLTAGALDPTFGTGGEVVTPIPSSAGITGLVLQPDGKLVAGGTSGSSLVLVRYLTNGAQDPTFGTGGAVTESLGFGVTGIALQSDGKILVTGTSGTLLSNNLSIEVARFLPNGALDSSFGSGGEATIGPGLQASAITVQSDGKIVVAGMTLSMGTTIQSVVIARLNSNGTIDTGFGSNGLVATTINGDAVPISVGVGIEPTGRIVTATGTGNIILVGFTAGGVLDQGFGTTTPLPGSGDRGMSVATSATPHGFPILPDGRIVVVGNVLGAGGTSDFAIARFFANGILDATFGQAGISSTDFGQNEQANAAAVQSDGRYVAAGSSLNSASVSTLALARYNPNGSLDTTFGAGGTVLTTFPVGSSSADQVVVQTDAHAVAAGVAGGNFALARYTADTPLPTANQRFVAQVYLDLLGRQADAGGLAQWSAMLDQGISRMQVVRQIQTSQEFPTDEVNTLYAQYLHRGVDPTGLNASLSFLRSGGTVEQLITLLVSSTEFRQTQAGGTNDGFLNALYQDALNRAVDPAGRSTWDQAFTNGASSAQVASAILASTEYRQDVVKQGYELYLRRQADPSGLSTFTNLLNQGTRDEVVYAFIIGSPEYFQRVG